MAKEKFIPEISKEDTDFYKLIGRAGGLNFAHCLMLAIKHAPNFWDRVAVHTKSEVTPDSKEYKVLTEAGVAISDYILVAFYENPPKSD